MKKNSKILSPKKLDSVESLLRMCDILKKAKATEGDEITEKEIKEYNQLQKQMIAEHYPLIQTMVDAGLFTAICWDENESMAGFEVEEASIDGGISLHCKTIILSSEPPPKYNFDEITISDSLINFKFDKNKPN